MKTILAYVVIASAAFGADVPWHLQPMDTWAPGECYRSPHASGSGGGATVTDKFKTGDLVTVDQPWAKGMTFRVTGETVHRKHSKTGQWWWFYPAVELGQSDDAQRYWLVEGEMTRIGKKNTRNLPPVSCDEDDIPAMEAAAGKTPPPVTFKGDYQQQMQANELRDMERHTPERRIAELERQIAELKRELQNTAHAAGEKRTQANAESR